MNEWARKSEIINFYNYHTPLLNSMANWLNGNWNLQTTVEWSAYWQTLWVPFITVTHHSYLWIRCLPQRAVRPKHQFQTLILHNALGALGKLDIRYVRDTLNRTVSEWLGQGRKSMSDHIDGRLLQERATTFKKLDLQKRLHSHKNWYTKHKMSSFNKTNKICKIHGWTKMHQIWAISFWETAQ